MVDKLFTVPVDSIGTVASSTSLNDALDLALRPGWTSPERSRMGPWNRLLQSARGTSLDAHLPMALPEQLGKAWIGIS